MRQSLTLVTAPAAEPVTLSEVKGWARIDTSDDDTLLTSLIAAARDSAEQYTRRSFLSQTWELTLDLPTCRAFDNLSEGVYDLPVSALYGEFPQSIHLPKGPVQSVTEVRTFDTSNNPSVYDSGNYFVDTAGDRLVLNDTATWPGPLRDRAAVTVTYVTGYGSSASDVPNAIRQAILIATANFYDGRGQCDDSGLPVAAKRLLNQYRIMGDVRG